MDSGKPLFTMTELGYPEIDDTRPTADINSGSDDNDSNSDTDDYGTDSDTGDDDGDWGSDGDSGDDDGPKVRYL